MPFWRHSPVGNAIQAMEKDCDAVWPSFSLRVIQTLLQAIGEDDTIVGVAPLLVSIEDRSNAVLVPLMTSLLVSLKRMKMPLIGVFVCVAINKIK